MVTKSKKKAAPRAKPKPKPSPPAAKAPAKWKPEAAPTAKGSGIVSAMKNIQVGFPDPPKPGSRLINKTYRKR
jgi:hypothetical protein